MRNFETPEIEIKKFNVEDVIATSPNPGNGDNQTGDDDF